LALALGEASGTDALALALGTGAVASLRSTTSGTPPVRAGGVGSNRTQPYPWKYSSGQA
jgi:hypothetical protein